MKHGDIPAFPRPVSIDAVHNYYDDQQGMSLLEYYAGQADIPWQVIENVFIKIHAQEPSIEQAINLRAELRFCEAEAMVKEAGKRCSCENKPKK